MTDQAAAGELPVVPAGPSWLTKLLGNRGAAVGLVLVTILVFTAAFAPWIAPYDPQTMGAGPRLSPPSLAHFFGTDEFGRDLFSRIVHGSRLTLMIAAIAVGIALTAGLAIGLIGGYAGGWIERIVMRLVDVVFSFTETLIALAAVAVLGPSLQNAMIAVGIATMPFYARICYATVLVEKSKPYFEASVAAGAGHLRIVLLHILPNILPTMVVVATLGVSTAILAAAGLSFLGLGAQPPSPEWGWMLSAGRDYFSRAPWMMIAPGIAISATVLGFNLLGDGIREVLDPRQTARR